MKNRNLLLGFMVLLLACLGLNTVDAQTNLPWISLGPNNVGGRTRTVVFDRFNDNVMYAGGVAGGLFISVNSGKNWHEIKLGNSQENLVITTIAQDSNGVIYLGTGEGNYKNAGFGINNDKVGMLGNGVYKSNVLANKYWTKNLSSDQAKYDWVDANMTFAILPFTKPTSSHNYGDGKSFVNKIAVNKKNNKVYVATDAGLMRINEDANNWTPIEAIAQTSPVGDISINGNGVIAVYFDDGEGKVILSKDDFGASNDVIFSTNELKTFEANASTINRIKLAFGIKNPDKLYLYTHLTKMIDGGGIYEEMLVRTDDVNNIQWRRTTSTNYFNSGNKNAMSIGIDDRGETEYVYLGGNSVMKGFNANNSDVYYWQRMSVYMNAPNSTNGIRTSKEFVSSGIHEIIFKESPKNIGDSLFIAAATDGGLHIYSFDSIAHSLGWSISAKDMVTSQFYSVAVTPDASVVGGTEATGSVYISNSGVLGANKHGDVLWTINSQGYNPNQFQITTRGGNVGASQFQRELPTLRKSLILSRPYSQIARTYGNNGDYSLIDDVTWNYSKTLFPNAVIEKTQIYEENDWRNYELQLTPMLLWESVNAQLPDTMSLVIDSNTAVNGVYNPEWRKGSWILPGDSVLAKSPNMEYPFSYKFTDSLQYNQDTILRIQNPIQSRLFFATAQGVWICSNINDYMASPLGGSLTHIAVHKILNFPGKPKEKVHCIAITDDGKTLFVATDKVGAASDTSYLHRFDLSTTNFFTIAGTEAYITPETRVFPRQITSITLDKKNGNNLILTFGTYISANSNMQVSSDALAQPFSSTTFKEVVSIDADEGTDFLPNNKPVFCALIESMNPNNTTKVAYIGAEDGIYRTDNFLGTPTAGGKVSVEWYKMQGIPNVPVFQLVQQKMNLPRYEYYKFMGQNSNLTTFIRTELPGAIYAATYGKGLFAYLGDTISPNSNVIGIKDNIIIKNSESLIKIYPNPASSTTYLEYQIANPSNVTLQVYDMNGRLVSTLDRGRQASGPHSVEMNVANMNKGVYLIRIITNQSTSTTKLIVN